MGFQATVFHSEQNGKPPEDSDQTFFKRSFYPLHDRGKRGGWERQCSGWEERSELRPLFKEGPAVVTKSAVS